MSQRKSEDLERDLRCPLCPRKFATLSRLRIHIKKVHKNQGRCPVCGKEFKDLTKHYRNAAIKYNDLYHRIMYVVTVGKIKYVPKEWIDETIEYLTVKD